MDKLIQMFLSFFKIGAFTFGGGYAMIPLIEAEVVDKHKWLDKEEFMDILVVSQSLPGTLAINCSTFIGYKLNGVLGGVIAMLAVSLPSFIIILLVATIFMKFRDNYYVNLAFKGITAAVPMLILVAIVSLSKGIKRNARNLIIMVSALIALVIFDAHPVVVISLSAIYGFIFLREKV